MAFNFLFLKAYDLFSHTKKAKWTRTFLATFKVPHPIGDMSGGRRDYDIIISFQTKAYKSI